MSTSEIMPGKQEGSSLYYGSPVLYQVDTNPDIREDAPTHSFIALAHSRKDAMFQAQAFLQHNNRPWLVVFWAFPYTGDPEEADQILKSKHRVVEIARRTA